MYVKNTKKNPIACRAFVFFPPKSQRDGCSFIYQTTQVIFQRIQCAHIDCSWCLILHPLLMLLADNCRLLSPLLSDKQLKGVLGSRWGCIHTQNRHKNRTEVKTEQAKLRFSLSPLTRQTLADYCTAWQHSSITQLTLSSDTNNS